MRRSLYPRVRLALSSLALAALALAASVATVLADGGGSPFPK